MGSVSEGLSPVVIIPSLPDTAGVQNLVTERFNYAQSYATASFTAALEFLNELEALAVGPVSVTTDLFDLLQTKLEYYINNGWDGLTPDIEAALWERTWERDEYALQIAKTRQSNDWSSTGFSLPDGVLSAIWMDMDKQLNDTRLTQSREIAIWIATQKTEFAKVVLAQAIELYVKEVQISLEAYVALMKLRESIVEGGARVAAQIAAAALAGVSASASMSDSESISSSVSDSTSTSTSTSTTEATATQISFIQETYNDITAGGP